MGLLYDYFAAVDDRLAATVIDLDGGPTTASQPGSPPRRPFRRKTSTPVGTVALDIVADTGIDPFVQMATLEALLTDRTYDEVLGDVLHHRVVAERNSGAVQVVTLTDVLTRALADADDDRLAAVAIPWSRTDEFLGGADPTELAILLQELAALTRRARDRGERIFCWACV